MGGDQSDGRFANGPLFREDRRRRFHVDAAARRARQGRARPQRHAVRRTAGSSARMVDRGPSAGHPASRGMAVPRSELGSAPFGEFTHSPVGQGISTHPLHRIVIEAARAAEVPKRVGPRMLRRSIATHLFEDGVDIRVIQGSARSRRAPHHRAPCQGRVRTMRAVVSSLDRHALLPARDCRPAEAMVASIEVADILRVAGPAFPASRAGHLSLAEVKVKVGGLDPLPDRRMLAFAERRPLRRARRPSARRPQLMPQLALSPLPGRGGEGPAGRAPDRPAAGRIRPRRLHAARRDRLPEQAGCEQLLVQGVGGRP